jgi:hypothetical protein
VGRIHQCIEDPVCQAIETFMCFGPAVFRLDHIEDRLLEQYPAVLHLRSREHG